MIEPGEKGRLRAPEPTAPQRLRFSWRAKGLLAIASTLVATATGMISLRNEIWPPDNDNVGASTGLYEQSVGDVCSSLSAADRARAANGRRLAKRLRRASGRTPLGQRDALLDSIKPVLQASEHILARFKGLAAPRPRAPLHAETEAAWDESAMRLRGYAQRLDAATTQADVLAAVRVLSAMRGPLARAAVKRAANLVKLAGGRCRLEEPIVTPTITLPQTPPSVDPPTPSSKPGPRPPSSRPDPRPPRSRPDPRPPRSRPDPRPPRSKSDPRPPNSKSDPPQDSPQQPSPTPSVDAPSNADPPASVVPTPSVDPPPPPAPPLPPDPTPSVDPPRPAPPLPPDPTPSVD